MLDHSFRLTFANFSTLFLLVLAIGLPLHLAHALATREVVAARSVADRVDDLDAPAGDITAEDVSSARTWYLLLNLIELALLVSLIPAARAIVEADEGGEVPTVSGGLRAIGRRSGWRLGAASGAWREVAVAALVALAVGYLVEATLNQALDLWTGASSFVGVAAAQATARATGAPFFLVTAALAARRAKVPPPASRRL